MKKMLFIIAMLAITIVSYSQDTTNVTINREQADYIIDAFIEALQDAEPEPKYDENTGQNVIDVDLSPYDATEEDFGGSDTDKPKESDNSESENPNLGINADLYDFALCLNDSNTDDITLHNDRDIISEENQRICKGISLIFTQQYFQSKKYKFEVYNSTGCIKTIKYKVLFKNIYGEWVFEKYPWTEEDIVYEYTIRPGNTIIGFDYPGINKNSKVKWLSCKCV